MFFFICGLENRRWIFYLNSEEEGKDSGSRQQPTANGWHRKLAVGADAVGREKQNKYGQNCSKTKEKKIEDSSMLNSSKNLC